MAVDYVARSAARTRRRETTDVATFVRRLDWILLASVGFLVGYGLWAIAGITRHDVTGNLHYYVVRQSVYVAVGFVGLLVALVIDPDWYRRHWRLIFGGTVFVIGVGQTVAVSDVLGSLKVPAGEDTVLILVTVTAGWSRLAPDGSCRSRLSSALRISWRAPCE